MSKRVKSLVAMLLVVLLLGGVLTVVLLVIPSDDGGASSSPDGSSNAILGYLTQKEPGEVQKVTVKNETTEYTAARNDTGFLVIPALEGIERDDTAYGGLLSAVSSISYERIIDENPEKPEEFGFGPTGATAEITFKDGSTLVMEYGHTAPSGKRYARIQGQNTIYLLTSASEGVFYPITTFVSTLIYTPETEVTYPDDELEVISVELGGAVREHMLHIEKNPSTGETKNSLRFSNHIITSPFMAGTSMNFKNTFPSSLNTLIASKVAAVNPTQEELTGYGLSTPYSTISFVTQATATTGPVHSSGSIMLGSKNSDGNYYAMIPGGRVVFVVTPDKVPWAEFKTRDLISNIPVLPPIDEVSTITVKASGLDAVFSPVLTEINGVPDVGGGIANGKEISAKSMSAWYESVVKVSIDDVSDQTPQGDPVFTYTVTYLDNSTPVTVSFYYLNDRTLLMKIDGIEGAPIYSVQSKKLDSLIAKTKQALQGEVVNPDT